MLAGVRTLFDILVENGKLTKEQAETLRTQQLSSGQAADKVILDSGIVTPQDVTEGLATLNNIPYVNVLDIGSSPEAMAMIDVGLARRYKMLPFSFDAATNRILVAMVNPLDLQAITFVEQKTGRRLVPHYAIPADLEMMIEDHYNSDISEDVGEVIEENEMIVSSQTSVKELGDLNRAEVIRQAPITKIVEQILGYAVGSGASDIHIEPQSNRVRVRFRIDGMLNEKLVLPKSVQDALISRVKILSNLKIDEKRMPQDGRFNFKSDKGEVDLRVSTLPTTNGEKVVMRLLRKMPTIPTLQELGMSDLALERFKTAIGIPHGIILVTGPTGSGKTTTLYSTLNIVNTKEVNTMTLEDPVEYEMAGVNQVQVNPMAGLTFASGLRSFLRQDPDIIMVGEIRDGETAGLAVQASLTGHQVFSTLHTNSAAGAIPRLIDMGIEPFLISSSVTLAMAQRVLRKINQDYKEAYTPDRAILEDIYAVLGEHFINWCKANKTRPQDVKLYRASEKRPSSEPDYKGRVAVYEVMPVDEDIQKLINKNPPAGDLERLGVQKGMLLMKQDGYIKALNGLTTIEEVLRVAQV